MRLTDDEIVATLVETGHVWPAPLHTVDTESAAAVLAAAIRGARSLVVRFDGDPSGAQVTDVPTGAVVSIATSASRIVAIPSKNGEAGTILIVVPSDAGGSIVDAVDPRGIHELSVEPTSAVLQGLSGLLRSAFEIGLGDDGEGSVVVSILAAEESATLQVTRGSLSRGALEVVDGRLEFVARRTTSRWSDTILEAAFAVAV